MAAFFFAAGARALPGAARRAAHPASTPCSPRRPCSGMSSGVRRLQPRIHAGRLRHAPLRLPQLLRRVHARPRTQVPAVQVPPRARAAPRCPLAVSHRYRGRRG